MTLVGRLPHPVPRFTSDSTAGKSFVDTNILVYAHDRSTGIKHLRAKALIDQLWDSGMGVISTQVLQEFCYNIRRKATKPLPIEEVRSIMQDYSMWEVVTNTSASILQAMDIELRYKISFWDALIVHAAESSGASILYSEDLASGQRYGSVELINPLLA